MTRPRLVPLTAALLLVGLVHAQDAPTPFAETLGRQAMADLPVIDTLISLNFSAAQAGEVLPVLTELAERGQQLDAEAAQAIELVGREAWLARDALLAGETVPVERSAKLEACAKTLEAVARQREEAVLASLAKVLERLNEGQRARLARGDGASGPGSAQAQEREAAERRELFTFQQSVYTVMTQLLERARNVTNNNQFRYAARGVALETAVQVLGLPPGEPLVQDYAQYLLGAMSQARTLGVVDYARHAQELATSMTQAAVYASTRKRAVERATAVDAAPVTTRDLDRLLRYPRTSVLLSMLSQLRPAK